MVHRRGLTPRSGIPLSLCALVLVGSLVACKKPPPPPAHIDDDAGPPPPDHLAKDEIPEGNEKAFTLVLPRESSVIYRIQGAVEVESMLTPEQLSNYVRKHVQTTKVTAGARTTTFDDALAGTDTHTHLRVDVRPAPPVRNNRSSMLVRDVTPLPPVPKTTDEDAYRNAGRNPDGTPLDPKHMF